MAYTIAPTPHADFYILTYTGTLETEDLLVADALHLNEGRAIYLLIDVSHMEEGLPDRFLETIMKSFVVHPNVAYMAVFITSTLLRVTANMVVKVTRQQKKITLHDSYESAHQRVMQAIGEHAL
jgi:hypothetical protein